MTTHVLPLSIRALDVKVVLRGVEPSVEALARHRGAAPQAVRVVQACGGAADPTQDATPGKDMATATATATVNAMG